MKMQRKALQRVPKPKYYKIGDFQCDTNRRTGTLLAIQFECEPTDKRAVEQGIMSFLITFTRDELVELFKTMMQSEGGKPIRVPDK